jgi:spore maturation protein A
MLRSSLIPHEAFDSLLLSVYKPGQTSGDVIPEHCRRIRFNRFEMSREAIGTQRRNGHVSKIWLLMLCLGIILAIIMKGAGSVTSIALSSTKEAIQVCIGLSGSIALWSGIARIAEESGLMSQLADLVRPLISPLFPGISPRSRAVGYMATSMAANLLGLGSAATPFGLRAMEELAAEARRSRGANISRGARLRMSAQHREPTDAMCTFAIVTASSLTLVPTTVLSLRAELGSRDPGSVIGATILATICSTGAAVLFDRLLSKGGQ